MRHFGFLGYTLSLVAGMLLMAASCTEKDAAPPVIRLISPEAGDTLSTGQVVPAIVELKDNRDLLQYTLIMRIKEEPIAGNIMEPYLAGEGIAVFGTELIDTYNFDIPAERAAGTYLLQASAIDLAANPSQELEIEVTMINGLDNTKPNFEVTSMDESGVNTYSPGAAIRIEGSASDNRELGGMRIEIFNGKGERLAKMEAGLSGMVDAFATSLNAPSNAGNYLLQITIADHANNLRTKDFNLEIK